MFNQIKNVLPNIPDEVIRLWLLPFAEGGGWPPTNENQWDVRKTGERVAFWNDATWEKVTLNIQELQYSRGHIDSMNGLFDAYARGVDNAYGRHLGNDGRQRFVRCLNYILQHRVFPAPPVVTVTDTGEYEVTDGNHRYVAYLSALSTHAESVNWTPEQHSAIQERLGIERIEPPHAQQEVWICRPNWDNSPNAQTRRYLRTQGIII